MNVEEILKSEILRIENNIAFLQKTIDSQHRDIQMLEVLKNGKKRELEAYMNSKVRKGRWIDGMTRKEVKEGATINIKDHEIVMFVVIEDALHQMFLTEYAGKLLRNVLAEIPEGDKKVNADVFCEIVVAPKGDVSSRMKTCE